MTILANHTLDVNLRSFSIQITDVQATLSACRTPKSPSGSVPTGPFGFRATFRRLPYLIHAPHAPHVRRAIGGRRSALLLGDFRDQGFGRHLQLLPTLGLRTWTVDVDGVVVSTGLQVERAARGYNPHQRKVPSYDPIMAHLAETTHILRVKNRSGNVHDGKAGLPFLRALWPQLVGLRTGGARLRFRMDGAFFRQDVLRWLQGPAWAMPQSPVLSLAGSAALHPGQSHLGAGGTTGFAVPGAETPWSP